MYVWSQGEMESNMDDKGKYSNEIHASNLPYNGLRKVINGNGGRIQSQQLPKVSHYVADTVSQNI